MLLRACRREYKSQGEVLQEVCRLNTGRRYYLETRYCYLGGSASEFQVDGKRVWCDRSLKNMYWSLPLNQDKATSLNPPIVSAQANVAKSEQRMHDFESRIRLVFQYMARVVFDPGTTAGQYF